MALSDLTLGIDFDFAVATDGDDVFNYALLSSEIQEQLANSPGIDAVALLAGDDNGIDDSAARIYFGNTGNDRIFGNGGSDTLAAGQNDDLLSGGEGDDFLFGNRDNDILVGNEGGDSIFGGRSDDLLAGEAGNDFLSGDLGNDTLEGGDGNDTLVGRDGNDLLSGNDDDDLLVAGMGVDDLRGGSGDDTLVFRRSEDVTDLLEADAIVDFDLDDDILGLDFSDYFLDDGIDLSNLLSFDGENRSEVDTIVRAGEQGPIIGVVVDVTARDLEERIQQVSIDFLS
ncbi:MAG: hypothetical protein J7641_05080 [Cyanobacteria bacterium SID2]|nr:hypothetical protein [Cyanobacteria bacterium SID2]MBP0006187.1 hypothetical protein [Cyanobacteria bacterium SBC]